MRQHKIPQYHFYLQLFSVAAACLHFCVLSESILVWAPHNLLPVPHTLSSGVCWDKCFVFVVEGVCGASGFYPEYHFYWLAHRQGACDFLHYSAPSFPRHVDAKSKIQNHRFFSTFSRIKKPPHFYVFLLCKRNALFLMFEEVKVVLKLFPPTSFPYADTERWKSSSSLLWLTQTHSLVPAWGSTADLPVSFFFLLCSPRCSSSGIRKHTPRAVSWGRVSVGKLCPGGRVSAKAAGQKAAGRNRCTGHST